MRISLLLVILVLLAACAGSEVPITEPSIADAETAPAAIEVQPAAPQPQELAAEAPPDPTSEPQTAAVEEPVEEVVDEVATEAELEVVTEEEPATEEPSTPTPPPLNVEEAAVVQVVSGQTAEGAFFLGDDEAELTIIDYSDFL